MRTIAIIGPTASGKSDLALRLALEYNCYILSIDSLSVYRHIDIASAKPSEDELAQVRHFGINILEPDEYFSVTVFLECYYDAVETAQRDGKNLLIIGGTGFYLKTLLTGLSELPEISEKTYQTAASYLQDLQAAHAMLLEKDPQHMSSIEPTDSYRIEKMLHLYLETGMTPSQWFEAHPAQPIVEELPLFEIDVDRETLRKRIRIRTDKMIQQGLIDEVCKLEQRYGRLPNSMKAIGIIEVLQYLDGAVTLEEMREAIITHTAQLAKRQQTFNRNQFKERVLASANQIYSEAASLLE